MAKLEFVIVLLVNSVNCDFFDFTDVDPLSLLWQNTKDFTSGFSTTQKNSPCSVPLPGGDTLAPGQCRHKTLCLLSGGQTHRHDNCGSFLTCCTQSAVASQRTKSKVSYFTSGTFSSTTNSELIVEAYSDNVCQVRLDFESFQLSPSEPVAQAGNIYSRVCAGDYMTVTPSIYNIPNFCGNNDGQHVYVTLNSARKVKLQVHFATRGSTASLAKPQWRIRITQLECPADKHSLAKQKLLLWNPDFELLAPEGATQYFFQPSGRIRSFGFSGSESEYISDLHYAIAFKRRPEVNCIKFTTNYLNLRHDVPANNNLMGHCFDYLFIPDFVPVIGTFDSFGSQLCSSLTATPPPVQIFTLNAPGPFYIFFRSRSTYTETGVAPLPVYAFDIQYELTSC